MSDNDIGAMYRIGFEGEPDDPGKLQWATEAARRKACDTLAKAVASGDRFTVKWTEGEETRPGRFGPPERWFVVRLEIGRVEVRDVVMCQYEPRYDLMGPADLAGSAMAEVRRRAVAWWRPLWRRVIGK